MLDRIGYPRKPALPIVSYIFGVHAYPAIKILRLFFLLEVNKQITKR